jgi:hypothetical protein
MRGRLKIIFLMSFKTPDHDDFGSEKNRKLIT